MSKHEDTMEKKDGMLIRDEEGNTYYIRREILHFCKIRTKDFDTEDFLRSKQTSTYRPDVKIIEPDAKVIGSIKFDEDPMPENAKRKVGKLNTNYPGDTYMCPW